MHLLMYLLLHALTCMVNISSQNPVVTMHIPLFPKEHMPTMHKEDDSVSTFHPGNTVNLTSDQESDEDEKETPDPPSGPLSPGGTLCTTRTQEHDAISRNSMSDSASRILSLETELSALNKAFRTEINNLQSQATQHANARVAHGTMLSEILNMLKQANLATLIPPPPDKLAQFPNPSNKADLLSTDAAGDSLGVTGHG